MAVAIFFLSLLHLGLGHNCYRFLQLPGFTKGSGVSRIPFVGYDLMNCVHKTFSSGYPTARLVWSANRQVKCEQKLLLNTSANSLHVELKYWPKKLAGACEDHTCAASTLCVPATRGYFCKEITNITKCDFRASNCSQKNGQLGRHNDVQEKETKPVPDEVLDWQKCNLGAFNEPYGYIAAQSNGHLYIYNTKERQFSSMMVRVQNPREFVIDFESCVYYAAQKQSISIFSLDLSLYEDHITGGEARLLRLLRTRNRSLLYVMDVGRRSQIHIYKRRGKTAVRITKNSRIIDFVVEKGNTLLVYSEGYVLERYGISETPKRLLFSKGCGQGRLLSGAVAIAKPIKTNHKLQLSYCLPNKRSFDSTQQRYRDCVMFSSAARRHIYLVDKFSKTIGVYEYFRQTTKETLSFKELGEDALFYFEEGNV